MDVLVDLLALCASLLVILALTIRSSGVGGGSIDCLSKNARRVLENPANRYVVRWTLICGIGRDFQYTLVYDENFVAKIKTDSRELDAQVAREIMEIERLTKSGQGICPSEVIERCRNAA